jgi:hypothetical protein
MVDNRSVAKDHGPYRLSDGWYVLVSGAQHGPWPDKGSAGAGYDVERRRAAKKASSVSADLCAKCDHTRELHQLTFVETSHEFVERQ